MVLPCRIITGRWPNGIGVLDDLGLNIDFWESNLRLYPFPADLIFGRSLALFRAAPNAR